MHSSSDPAVLTVTATPKTGSWLSTISEDWHVPVSATVSLLTVLIEGAKVGNFTHMWLNKEVFM